MPLQDQGRQSQERRTKSSSNSSLKAKKLITCALPYANGVAHLGHLAGTCLPSDVYARFCRLQGEDVHFVSGSDEYGMAITLSAQLEGRSPQEHVDLYHHENVEIFKKFGLSFDHYVRTTWPGHVAPVQRFFTDLLEAGYIEARRARHLYSAQDAQFLADRYVEGECPKCHYSAARGDECPRCGASYEASELLSPRSKITGKPLELKETEHWYLRLDLFKEQLKNWLETKKWKSNVVNFIKPYIEDLRPRAITRDSSWGVPVPLPQAKENKVLYVWFDAPIAYISASMQWGELQGKSEAYRDYWCDPQTQLVQFLGKDNIPFHAIIFPAMIMGQKEPYKLVDALPANEFYHLEGRKFSKSQGWTLDVKELLDTFDPEILRYVIAASAPEQSDAEFTWSDFQMRLNGELVGKWGNFIYRTLSFVQRFLEGRRPVMREEKLTKSQRTFLELLREQVDLAEKAYAGYSLRGAVRAIMAFAQESNSFFDASKPWAVAKMSGQEEALEQILALCLRAIELLALISAPIMPQTCQRVWQQLGYGEPLTSHQWSDLVASTSLEMKKATKVLPKPSLLFAKVEEAEIKRRREVLHERARKATH